MAKTSTAGVVVLSSLFAAGCGGDGSDAPVTAELGTLAYVVSECRDTPEGFCTLRRARNASGQVINPDGTFSGQLLGAVAYGPQV